MPKPAPERCRCHNRGGLAPHQHENDCPLVPVPERTPQDDTTPAKPAFEGHQPRECGEHRTVGPHRAWCHDCSMWCYPHDPCFRCVPPEPTTAPVTAETDCPSCDTCGSMPCQGGCRTANWADEERHVCVDEDACRVVVNRRPGAPVTAEDTEPSREGVDWHRGPHPAFGFMTTHVGPREQCTGPDCEPEPDDTEPTAVWDLREMVGQRLEAAQVRDADGVAALVADVVSPVLERYRKAVEDAPGSALWTGACVECGTSIRPGDAITWRLRWSPRGPIHEECR